jgi:predicted aspartyl protease
VALVVSGIRELKLNAVIDTGFDGDLCLPRVRLREKT